ncbi:MAG: ROK family protein, partial [Burkholderiaceae bacterium]
MNADFNHEWIVADIGGTYARFNRWSSRSGLSDNPPARYRNDDFRDLAALINRYRGDAASDVVRAMLALALPVEPGEMRMTNRNWAFTAQGLRADAGLAQLRLVNDFVAAAAGIGALSASESIQIGGLHSSMGSVVVLGPGTGLGTAVILNDGPEPRVMPSEAGHMSAAPSRNHARTVFERSRVRHGRVSWERLLCGNGLALFDAVARGTDEAVEPADVAARAQAGDPAARSAASAFAQALGEFAGDLCLAFNATGVYLTGGVLDGLGRALDADALRDGFEDKGRFRGRLHPTPCYRVCADDLALRGLARLLEGKVRAPVFET